MSRIMTTVEAIQESRRCLNCARPMCRTGCPIENNIPGFIRALSEGNIGMAYEIISERSNLPAICGRVCPHERQCEAHCILTKKKCGLQIGSLGYFRDSGAPFLECCEALYRSRRFWGWSP